MRDSKAILHMLMKSAAAAAPRTASAAAGVFCRWSRCCPS